MKTRGLVGVLLVALAFALFAMAGDCVAAEGSSSDSNPWLGKIRPGFSTGTTSGTVTDGYLDLMIPLWGDQKHLIYLNPQFRMDDAGGNEENLGLGYRGLYFNDQAILGVNFFYDTMLSKHDFRYDQFGVGIEALTKWVDLRGNYYVPFGTTKNRLPGLDYYRFGQTYISWYRGYEEATEGFDGEVGFLVPIVSNVVETRVYAGGYHYTSDVASDVNGWKTRLEVRPVDLLQISMEVRDDNVRGTDVFFGAYLDIPFSVEAMIRGQNPFEGIEKHLVFGKGARPLKERMTDKVERDRDITTFARPTDTSIPDPIANNVIYVNADNPNTGTGTYSNPYRDIASVPSDLRYTDGAWVYVFSWDKLADTYNNVHLQLVNNGVLWGQGYFYPHYRLGGDGPMPILDGGFGSAVPVGQGGFGSVLGFAPSGVLTLAQNNEIMGLTIQHGQEGIYGQNIYRTNIHDNLIRDNGGIAVPTSLEYNAVPVSNGFSGGNGIHIDNVFDPAEVSGSTLAYVLANNTVTGNAGAGIYLNNIVAGSASINNLTISNSFTDNTITNNAGLGFHLSNVLSTAGGISGSTITNTFTGNRVSGSPGVELLVDNILVTGTGVSSSSIANTFTGNSVGGSSGMGFYVNNTLVAGTGVSSSSIANAFTDNSVTGSSGMGFYVNNTLVAGTGVSSSSIANAFTGNRVSGSSDDGLFVSNIMVGGTGISSSLINNAFTGNTVTGNQGSYGLAVFDVVAAPSMSNLSISVFMQDNRVTDNAFDGVFLNFFAGGGAAKYTADLGGGTLGSLGRNSFFGSGCGVDLVNDTGTAVSATNNWWGQSTGPAAGQIFNTGLGTVNSTPWLTTAP